MKESLLWRWNRWISSGSDRYRFIYKGTTIRVALWNRWPKVEYRAYIEGRPEVGLIGRTRDQVADKAMRWIDENEVAKIQQDVGSE